MFWLIIIFLYFVFQAIQIIFQDNHGKSSYVPNPKGHWVNRGDDLTEDWVWVEEIKPEPILLYVSLIEEDGGYHIIVEEEPLKDVDSIECESISYAETVSSIYYEHYKPLGKVTICDRTGLLNKREIKRMGGSLN